MRGLALVLVCLAMLAPRAATALTRNDLAAVGVSPPPRAAAPLGLAFRDQDGRAITLGAAISGKPALLVFADYNCRTLCGPALVLTAAGLRQAGLKPGADYRLVVIGLNPKDAPVAARAMRDVRLNTDPALARASSFLVGDAAAIRAATAAMGFRYVYDPVHDQFAHDAAAFALSPDGRLARVLSALNLSGPELRLALVGAGEGKVGDLGDRLRWLCVCYGFDPAAGIYDAGATLALKLAGLATILLLGGFLAAAVLRPAPR
jgi:protein SCO1/2